MANHYHTEGLSNQHEKVGKKPRFQTIMLVKEEWKKMVPYDFRKIIIARALNEGVREKGFEIIGYLITERRLVLILKNHQTQIKKMIKEFYKLFVEELKKYLKGVDDLKYHFLLGDESDSETGKHLFKRYRLFDETLERLLTGRAVNEHYYDPHVARLEHIIQHYNYCSALDYSCGISPVLVDRVPKF